MGAAEYTSAIWSLPIPSCIFTNSPSESSQSYTVNLAGSVVPVAHTAGVGTSPEAGKSRKMQNDLKDWGVQQCAKFCVLAAAL